VKEFLSREGYAFTVKNVEEDDRAYDALMALGIRAVPVTVINGTPITGFNEAALGARLASES
jgi:glutaredoxin